ncbi:MAG: AAA family ATPase [Gammaproteobacteria bacterium]|nr:AAA family ATPase [Gammaproteobacteria bacterium]
MTAPSARNAMLIQSLQNPSLYDHPIEHFEVIETHISWVLLTGPYAYKIKKPVNLGFLDFSTLEKRHHYCQEELRLNRRLSPELYLDVIAITGGPDAPVLDGAGAPIEYAVKMAQFPQQAQMDRVMARGGLKPAHIDGLAQQIAAFHGRIAIAGANSPYGSPANVYQPVEENFLQIRPHLAATDDITQLERLRAWSEAAHGRRLAELQARKDQGFIRECHGDMHLANMVLLDDRIALFDCLEFNDNLRWIDVISETAFLMMDLDSRGHGPLGWRFLNGYLSATGDYSGLRLLRYYLVYRALVRAKVARIRLGQAGLSAQERHATQQQYHRYADLAEHYTHPRPAPLIITHGLSGSGKTTLTQPLLEALGAIRLRSDVERKRLFGLPEMARTGSGVATGLYTADASQRTYQHLANLARTAIESGLPVIVDATFLKRAQRAAFHELASQLHAPFGILDYQASETALRARIGQRTVENRDASEAGIAVLEHQLATHEPLTPEESAHVIAVDTEQVNVPDHVISELSRRMR